MRDSNEWIIARASFEEFERITSQAKNAFNRAPFIALNAAKVDEVDYLIIRKGGSIRFAFAAGKQKGNWYCPFSAPFSYPEQQKRDASIESFYIAADLIDSYLRESNIRKATFVFPPSFYDSNCIAGWTNALYYQGWLISTIDLNFSFNLSEIDDYEKCLARNARKNLRIAQSHSLSLRQCQTINDQINAYQIIANNRRAKGYPLRMTQSQVINTMKIIPSSMYIVSSNEGDLAAALVYDVTDDIAQVVYWGDNPGNQEKKPINYLSSELIRIYKSRGFKVLDIGPSTENGIPNIGLCNFKDSIGCTRTVKLKFEKSFTELT